MYTSMHIYPADPIDHRQTEYSQKHKQHQKPYPAPFSGWAGWRFTSENVCGYLYLCIDIYMYAQQGGLQQLGLDSQSAQ